MVALQRYLPGAGCRDADLSIAVQHYGDGPAKAPLNLSDPPFEAQIMTIARAGGGLVYQTYAELAGLWLCCATGLSIDELNGPARLAYMAARGHKCATLPRP